MLAPIFEREVHRQMAKMMEADADTLMAQVRRSIPEPTQPSPQPLELYEVRSYVVNADTLTRPSFSRVIVPAFAVHWGVVVGPTLYHLVFRNPADAALESKDPSRRGKEIRFTFCRWDDDTKSATHSPVVGNTRFNHQQLCVIGDKLIEAFGDYHRLFWNCQVFAKCYLRLITDGKDFDRLTDQMRSLIVDSHPRMLPICFSVA